MFVWAFPCETSHVKSPETAAIRDFANAHHAALSEDKNFMHETIYKFNSIQFHLFDNVDHNNKHYLNNKLTKK